jgi:putative endonuclease
MSRKRKQPAIESTEHEYECCGECDQAVEPTQPCSTCDVPHCRTCISEGYGGSCRVCLDQAWQCQDCLALCMSCGKDMCLGCQAPRVCKGKGEQSPFSQCRPCNQAPPSPERKEQKEAHVYMVRCSDGSLYTGWTNNVTRRVKRHNRGQGSKYVRARLPAVLVYTRTYKSQSEAMSEERRIKALSKKGKETLIATKLVT